MVRVDEKTNKRYLMNQKVINVIHEYNQEDRVDYYLERWEEHAAILEYDLGLPRWKAELEARIGLRKELTSCNNKNTIQLS
jgi:hypothetical protein